MRLELWEGLLAEAEDKRLSDRKSLKPDRLELTDLLEVSGMALQSTAPGTCCGWFPASIILNYDSV